MDCLFWNCRGAASPGFKCHLRNFVRRTNPMIVILLETRASGVVADFVVRKLGFVNSFRIEAQGFSDRIWILWSDLAVVEVKLVSTQFVNCCFRPVNSQTCSQLTAVYASPSASAKKLLWGPLA
ncbi:hypothetical protein V6N13_087859 [Hibiscus sabdariffa]